MANKTLPEIDILLIGHIAADVVPGGFSLGGTVAYSAATAHAFGLRAGVVTSARDDEPLLDELRQHAHVVNVPAEESTSFENIYKPEGRTQFWRAQAADLAAKHVPTAWHQAPLVHLGPLTDEVDADVLSTFADDAKVLVTPQGWMRRRDHDQRVLFKSWFNQDVLDRADIVIYSVEDVAAAPEMINRYGKATSHMVVTEGDMGGVLYINGQPDRYAAVPVNTVDPTGAGDIFALSALFFWSRFGDIHRAVRAAAYITAYSTTRPGITGVPTQDEITQAVAYSSS